MKRVAIAVKTTERGTWTLPQITETQARGIEVHVILPNGEGRLDSPANEILCLGVGVHPERSTSDFVFRPVIETLRALLGYRALLKSLHVDVVLHHLYASALAIRLSGLGVENGKEPHGCGAFISRGQLRAVRGTSNNVARRLPFHQSRGYHFGELEVGLQTLVGADAVVMGRYGAAPICPVTLCGPVWCHWGKCMRDS